MNDTRRELNDLPQLDWGDVPKDDNGDDQESKWHRRRLRLTGDFVGGAIAGVGLGMITAIQYEWPYPVDLWLIFIGGAVAYYFQLGRDFEQRSLRS